MEKVASNSEQQAAPAPSAAAPPVTGRRAWVRAAADRVPMKWLTGALTAVFLAITAAFGGLATVDGTTHDKLAAGEEFTAMLLDMTVVDATVSTANGLTLARDDDDTPVVALTVVIDVTNTDNVPRPALDTFNAYSGGGTLGEVQLAELSEKKPDILRTDGTKARPMLQPGVPEQIKLTWAIPATDVPPSIELHIPDAAKRAGTLFADSTVWDRTGDTITVTVPVTDAREDAS